MSRTLSMNKGSLDNLNVSERCGAREKARQMRLIAVWFTPVACAIVRVDQWVAAGGLLSSVRTITSSICASLSLRGCPGRDSSSSPSNPRSSNLRHHLLTV